MQRETFEVHSVESEPAQSTLWWCRIYCFHGSAAVGGHTGCIGCRDLLYYIVMGSSKEAAQRCIETFAVTQ
jgi:hypothetical protein